MVQLRAALYDSACHQVQGKFGFCHTWLQRHAIKPTAPYYQDSTVLVGSYLWNSPPPPQPYPTWGGSLLRPYYNKIQLYVEHVGEGGWGCYGCDVRGSITVAGRILQTCRICKTEKLLSRLISWFTERAIPDNSFFFVSLKPCGEVPVLIVSSL